MRFSLLVVMAASIALGACEEQKVKRAPVIRPVRIYSVQPASASNERTFSGTSRAGTESRLSFKVGGQISKRAVKVGARVTKGQLIAAIDDKDFKLQLRQAQAALAQARAQARNARASYERTKKLYENRSVSLKDIDNARASADSAKAAVAAQAQATGLARLKIGYCKLLAPADGQIASVAANVNENVKAGQAIAVLNSGELPEVKFTVPESLIGRVKKGDKASVSFSAIKKLGIAATVTEVGVAGGGTAFPVTVRLDRAQKEVRAGMAAEVKLTFGAASGAAAKRAPRVHVPAHAVAEDGKGRFVFVAVGEAGGTATVERRPVKTGRLGRAGLEILDGLKAGDRVVVAGIRFIEPRMKVRLLGKK